MEFKIVEISAEQKFRMWYEEPIEELKKLDSGNGAIAALMMALPLYERAYRFEVEVNKINDNRPAWVKDDLSLNSEEEAKIFWNVFRDGLCHTGSFFEESARAKSEGWTLPKIGLDNKYPNLPRFDKNSKGEDVIIANPWGLVSHVLKKYKGNTPLLEYAPAPLLPLKYIVESAASEQPTPNEDTNLPPN